MTSSVRDLAESAPAEPGPSTTPRPATNVWLARLCGVIAGLAGLAIADLVSRFTSLTGAPIPAVGGWLISLFPASVIDFGKTTLGTADKPVLLIGIGVVSLLVAGLAGQLELRRRWGGLAVFLVLAVLSFVGVHAAADATLASYLPTLVGMALGYAILESLITRAARAHRADAPSAERRRFLRTVIIGGSVAAVGFVVARTLQAGAAAVSTARSLVTLPAAGHQVAADVPAGAELGLPDLTPYVTANADFYRIDTALQVPSIDPATWSLTVTGLVENEITMSFADLLAEPMTEHLASLTCVSNEVGGDLAGNALWLGWPIRELLARAKPRAGADMVLSTSHDGFTAGTPLEALTDPERLALLAVGMNGEPLPVAHGFPVRMVVPGLYGYVSATKWVTQLKVTTFAADQGYWTPLGWSAKGPIKLASRIDVPSGTVDAGTVAVAGVAWRQHVGVKAVEVSVDNGAWESATLAATAGPDTWRQWSYPWAATPGTHAIRVRAIDAEGNVQTDAVAAPAPDGASGYHQVSVKVR
ncbi:MAG: molybdopterin-dependent oxidoreductase [Propionibacteriaceae bacterium]